MEAEILKSFCLEKNDLEGWFFPHDMLTIDSLDRLHSKTSVIGNICEIGVYRGKSFSFLSHLIKEDEKLFGYDIFDGNDYEYTKLALEKYAANVKFELIKADTSELSHNDIREKLNKKGIRILHHDAGHEYHEVLHSLMSFAPYVLDSGIIVVDDYQDPDFPGVEAAVLDFSEIDRPKRFIPFFSGGNKIYLCRTFMAMPFQKHLLLNINFQNKCRLSIIRDFSILKGFTKQPTNYDVLIKQIDEFNELGNTHSSDYDQDLKELKIKSNQYCQIIGNRKVSNTTYKSDFYS